MDDWEGFIIGLVTGVLMICLMIFISEKMNEKKAATDLNCWPVNQEYVCQEGGE